MSDKAPITLPHDWVPYDWQLDVLEAREKGIKRIALAVHRRAGKSVLMLNLLAIEAHKVVGSYAIMFPFQVMARRAIWRESDNNGRRLIDQAFPPALRKQTREQELSIELLNGSVIYLLSADDPRAAVGSNLKGVVFDEFALYPDDEAWQYTRPILQRNGGWAAFISTYRGTNHHYQLVRLNKNNPDWYVRELTVDDTYDHDGRPLVTPEMIEADRRSGMSEALIQQEYYCSPVAAFSGAYYQTMMRRAREEGRIGDFPWNPNERVFCVFDIGYSDLCVAGFFQALEPNKTVWIGSKAWQFTPPAEIMQDIKRTFPWGSHISTVILPHDANRPGPTGDTWVSTVDKHRLALDEVTVLRKGQGTLHAEIAHVQQSLATCYFDNAPRPWLKQGEHNNDTLIESLTAYRTEQLPKRPGVYSRNPLHDSSSHWADMVRYGLVYRHGDYGLGGWGKAPDWSAHDRMQVSGWR